MRHSIGLYGWFVRHNGSWANAIALHHKIESGSTVVWGMDPRTGNVWQEVVDGKNVWGKNEK